MSDPRDAALAVVRKSLEEHPEILIACQYLGMLKDDALLPLKKEGDTLVGQIAHIVPESIREIRVPPPGSTHTYTVPLRPVESMAIRFDGDRMTRENTSPIHPETGRTLFSMWVEKEIPWSPAVMGWTDDDPRVDAMLRETGG